jgi:hypothetical protein
LSNTNFATLPVSGISDEFKILAESSPKLYINLLVPEAGIEPACLAAGDFLTTSAFAAIT